MAETKAPMNTMNPPANRQPAQSKVISHTFYTGTAKLSSNGPPIGMVDVGVSEKAYLFRISLPGIEKKSCKLNLGIQKDGTVCLEGVVPEMAISRDTGCLYRMQVQHSCPPGPFSITFNLPGQVDTRIFETKFRPGILEAVVFKTGLPKPTS